MPKSPIKEESPGEKPLIPAKLQLTSRSIHRSLLGIAGKSFSSPGKILPRTSRIRVRRREYEALCLYRSLGIKIKNNILLRLYRTINRRSKVLIVVGGGTAAWTYLYTHDISSKYSHVIVLGGRGYWKKAAHRLAQPHHILALPDQPSAAFINPTEHDTARGILPHESTSAYTHSRDYQRRLEEFSSATISKLRAEGIIVHVEGHAIVSHIRRSNGSIQIKLKDNPLFFPATKVVVATGAGPARRLPKDLQDSLFSGCAGERDAQLIRDRILDYTDVLSRTSERICGKEVLIYGGGATAAWAMEVAALKAKPLGWLAKSGFEQALIAGPRVGAIIARTRGIQRHATIKQIKYIEEGTAEPKLMIEIENFDRTTEVLCVDYLLNCIGQDQYELGQGGLPEIFSEELRHELRPLLDSNRVTGLLDDDCMLGWTTEDERMIIIGAAQGTFYDRDAHPRRLLPTTSDFIPRSGQVRITIGGVISTICALNNFMPFMQNPLTGVSILLSLNLHVMNATQLTVYFTILYPDAPGYLINQAVDSFIAERSITEFGLNDDEVYLFMALFFPGARPESLENDPYFSSGSLMPRP